MASKEMGVDSHFKMMLILTKQKDFQPRINFDLNNTDIAQTIVCNLGLRISCRLTGFIQK
jgi:hypothetical protein